MSIGDYVLSGGELPAAVVIDSCVRLIPGALGDDESATFESFSNGRLDWPQYAVAPTASGENVPPELAKGDHAAIDQWRRREALIRTWKRRPDLLLNANLTLEEQAMIDSTVEFDNPAKNELKS